jgi:hypothetical protein
MEGDITSFVIANGGRLPCRERHPLIHIFIKEVGDTAKGHPHFNNLY